MSGTKMSSISISVKTSLVDDMGILCVINPNNTIGEVLAKVTDDLGLDETAISLVRLMPGGKAMHSRVLNPTLLTETDCYLAIFDQGLQPAADTHPASGEYVISTPVQAPPVTTSKRGRVVKVRLPKGATVVTPAKKSATTATGKKQRHKAVAAVAAATAAVKYRTGEEVKKPRIVKSKRSKVLSPAQRQTLADVPFDLDLFERFLYDVLELGTQNVNLVMKQIRLMTTGQGIRYKNWRKGVVFKPGYVIALSDDFEAMRQESLDFEKKYGKDLGNGYLMRHPLRKLDLYQIYLYNNPSARPGSNIFAARPSETTSKAFDTRPAKFHAARSLVEQKPTAMTLSKNRAPVYSGDQDSDSEESDAGLIF